MSTAQAKEVLREYAVSGPLAPASADYADAAADFLRGFDVAFVDSLEGLRAAQERGLSASAELLTSAPALAMHPQWGLRTRATLDRARRDAFLHAVHELSLALFRAFSQHGLERFAPAAAAQGVFFACQCLSKTAILEDADFLEPRAVIVAQSGSARLDSVLNARWPALLAENPALRILNVPIPLREAAASHPPFLQRLRLSPSARAYRLLQVLSRRLPVLFRRGRALVVAENELLCETAVCLGLRGVAIAKVPIPAIVPEPLPSALQEAVAAAVEPILTPVLRRWAPLAAHAPLTRLFLKDLAIEFALQDASERHWRQELLERAARSTRTVLLSNFPKATYGGGLWRAAREVGIPLVSFQHGIGREFGRYHFVGQAMYENSRSDHFVVYNDMAARVTDASPFAAGRTVVAGIASEFMRTARFRRPKSSAQPILYVSTNLYAGHSQIPSGVLSDAERAVRELRLAKEVFDRLPHRVLFKIYPETRYVEHPIAADVRACRNLLVFDVRLDARYLLPDCRVVVTSRATSTLGVCVTSGKPVVFINDPDDQPIAPEVEQEFRDALFFFDASAHDYLDTLRTFLSQDLSGIESQWRAKAEARAHLTTKYFSKVRRGAGGVAAEKILAIMSAPA